MLFIDFLVLKAVEYIVLWAFATIIETAAPTTPPDPPKPKPAPVVVVEAEIHEP